MKEVKRCPILKSYSIPDLEWGLTRDLSQKTREELENELKMRRLVKE